jgi:lysine-specific demethylase 8
MPLFKFMHDYLSPDDPMDIGAKEIGYLGQHNLFHQIPKLQQDIRIPDYCYTAPPETRPASRLDLPAVPPVDEPQKNIWLGPKGTRTPLHTDPYHNIFCQVVGHKYVRLYPPEATETVYPRGEDENGINESNTSSVEIKLDHRQANNVAVQDAESFPLFLAQTNYHEVVVGPGECLYIPAGWWHYIESLTPSSSVSFWWN